MNVSMNFGLHLETYNILINATSCELQKKKVSRDKVKLTC